MEIKLESVCEHKYWTKFYSKISGNIFYACVTTWPEKYIVSILKITLKN